MDLVTSGFGSKKIAWYRNRGKPNVIWGEHPVETVYPVESMFLVAFCPGVTQKAAMAERQPSRAWTLTDQFRASIKELVGPAVKRIKQRGSGDQLNLGMRNRQAKTNRTCGPRSMAVFPFAFTRVMQRHV